MSPREPLCHELDRNDLAALQNALFDYGNALEISRPVRAGRKWALDELDRVKRIRETVSALQADQDGMPMILDARPEAS